MNNIKTTSIEDYLKYEMLQLKIKKFIIKNASKRFNLSKEDVTSNYLNVRSKIQKEAINRGVIYLLLSSIFLFVGIKSFFGDSGYIYLGGLLFGSAGILTGLGYFVLAIKGNFK